MPRRTSPPGGDTDTRLPESAGPEPTGLDRGLIVICAVAMLGAVMSILDATIVNVAVATLGREFDTSLTTIQWVVTGYLLALAVVIPMTGWAADRFGAKQLYLVSIALFAGGSALAGLAWSAGSLIAFRLVQGLGGGMILPAGITILTRAAGPHRIGRVMSIVGVPMMLAPMVGPILGGWIVDDFSWRWLFYVNVPVGAVTLALAYRVLPRDHGRPADRLDVVGLALVAPGLAAIVYGLAETSSAGGFGSTRVLVSLAAGVSLLVAFVRYSLRARNPLLDLRLFRHRAVAAASGTIVLFAMSFFGTMFLLPLYFQVVRGESPLAAGLLLAPGGLGAACAMPSAGRLVDRSGAGKVVLAGLGVAALGTVPFAQVGISTSYWLLGGAQFVRGLGLGMVMMPAMSAAYQVIDHAAMARATSTLNSIQRVGGSIGTALVAVVLEHQITGGVAATSAGHSLGAIAQAPAAVRNQIAPELAAAFGHTFWWTVALTVVPLAPAALLPRTKAKQAVDTALDETSAAAPTDDRGGLVPDRR